MGCGEGGGGGCGKRATCPGPQLRPAILSHPRRVVSAHARRAPIVNNIKFLKIMILHFASVGATLREGFQRSARWYN